MLKTCLNSKKKNLTVISSRDGHWIKFQGNRFESSSLFFFPSGQPISIQSIWPKPYAESKDVIIRITSVNMSFDYSVSSTEDGEKIIQQLQKALQRKGSLTSKIIKTSLIGIAVLVAYLVIGAGFQAREIMSAQQTQKTHTEWKSNPDDLEKNIEPTPIQGAEETPVNNIDQLLSQTPVMPDNQDQLAKSIYEGAMKQGQRDFAQAVPPTTSTSGLDQFGLAAPATGCDPSLAFDKK